MRWFERAIFIGILLVAGLFSHGYASVIRANGAYRSLRNPASDSANNQSQETSFVQSIFMKMKQNLVNLFIKMQKRTEAKYGISHDRREEADVGVLFEGDIALSVPQATRLLSDLSARRRRKRKLAESPTKRWSLPIPYMFDGTHSIAEQERILEALAYWQMLTCIDFVYDPNATHKLLFTKGRGCWSYVGYTHHANQTISIGEGCQSNGTIAHEVGHAIGFWHEQSRPDRDNYIIIHQLNITHGKLYNFDKRNWGEIVTLDLPYDLGSDMHYGAKFYAKDANSSLMTVETRDPLMTRVIGQRQELSFYDVKLANKAYCKDHCPSQPSSGESCQRDGYWDPRQCDRCRCPDGFGGYFCQRVALGVNAYCGGILEASFNGTIYSPGYPTPGYRAGVACSWLIRAPAGYHVHLRFVGAFGVAGHVDVCKDYVEVRYNSRLSLTGARFCCDDPPREEIVSHTNEMLLLFRTFKQSRVCDDDKFPWKCRIFSRGFRASYYMAPCGGCGDRPVSPNGSPACRRKVAYECVQSWLEKVKMNCPDWWYTPSCGVNVAKKVRKVVCYRDMPYCCEGHELKGDRCIAHPQKAVKRSNSMNVSHDVQSSTPAHTSSITTEAGLQRHPPSAAHTTPQWQSWGNWTECQRSCGGDVIRRTRRCTRMGQCGTSNVQIERKTCAQTPCYRKCKIKKKILCDLWATCSRTVYELCKPYCHIGFVLQDKERCSLKTA